MGSLRFDLIETMTIILLKNTLKRGRPMGGFSNIFK